MNNMSCRADLLLLTLQMVNKWKHEKHLLLYVFQQLNTDRVNCLLIGIVRLNRPIKNPSSNDIFNQPKCSSASTLTSSSSAALVPVGCTNFFSWMRFLSSSPIQSDKPAARTAPKKIAAAFSQREWRTDWKLLLLGNHAAASNVLIFITAFITRLLTAKVQVTDPQILTTATASLLSTLSASITT